MGRYQAYPEYKDSGVDWIGQIPIDWDMWKIFHACDYIASGTTPKSDDESKYYGGDTLWVTTGELRENVVLDTQKKVTQRALLDMPTLRVHPEGSVAIAMYGATIGRLGIFGREATTNQACCVMPPSKILFNKFLFYWLFATRQEIINLSSGGGQPNVNQEKIASLKVSAPDFALQQKIANFLDHETAKIDTLIEKQQQLIQLLKEKRQAVISHAVTKGLNPDALMKDSGVEWLGEVPAHWEVWKFGHFAPIITCGIASTPTYVDEDVGMPFLSAQNVQNNKLSLHKYNFIPKELHEQLTRYRKPERGDILVTRVGAGIGDACVIDIDMEFSIYVSLTHIRVNPDVAFNKFIMYFFSTDYCHFLNHQGTVTGGGVGNLNVQNVIRYNIPLPSLAEQSEIVSHIESMSANFERLIVEAEKSIQLANERRTALISAAVTGKFDVRTWQAPNN